MEVKLCAALAFVVALNFGGSRAIIDFSCDGIKCVAAEIQSSSEFFHTLKSDIFWQHRGREKSELVEAVRDISCENSSLEQLPFALFEIFTNLQSFAASNVQLKQLRSGDFLFAGNLRELNLSRNFLAKIDENLLINLHSLEKIDFSFNQIEWVDENAFEENSGRLKMINLSYNRIKVFKEDFLMQLSGKLKHLQQVNLEGNNMIEILKSSEANVVVSITSLDLSKNKLKSFELSNVKIVLKLILDDNDIKSLRSDGVDQLSIRNNGLQELFIANGTILLKADRNELLLLKCDKCDLKHVSFVENKNGNKILQSLQNVSGLISLEMSKADLTSLSLKSLERLVNLLTLKLDYNKINFIADGNFANQKILKHLNISHNILSSLSISSLSSLHQLTVLDVSGNNILKIHGYENMRKVLPSMSFIGIFGNKFEGSYLLKLLQTLKAQNIEIMSTDGSVSRIGMKNVSESSIEVTTLGNLTTDITDDMETAANVEEFTQKIYEKPAATASNETEQKCDGNFNEPSSLVEKISLIMLCIIFLLVIYLSWCLKHSRDSLELLVLQQRRSISSKRSSTSTLAAFEDTFY